MPDLNHILESHPYLVYLIVLVWTFLEGETIVIVAGIAARDTGHPWLWLIILCAFTGSLCSDQLMFFLGRYKGKTFVAKRPKWQLRAQKVYDILEKHQTWLILGFRFLYGLRNVTPLVIGMSDVRTRRFMILNIIGALIWAVTFSGLGYVFGAAVEKLLTKEHKVNAILLLLVVALVAWLVRINRQRAAAQKKAKSDIPPAV